MSWSSDDSRDVTVADLTQFDIGRRVRFRRGNSDRISRPEIHGKLVRIEAEDYWRGNMLRRGYRLTVAFPSKWGGYNQGAFGPMPGTHKIWVGPVWVHRKAAFEIELENDDMHFEGE